MNEWEDAFGLMTSEHQYVSLSHEEDKVIVFEKGPLLFIFNFDHSKSYEDYKIGTCWGSDHIILYETDSKELGGHGRLEQGKTKRFVPKNLSYYNRDYQLSLYLPCRTAIVLIPEENITEDVKKHGVVMPPIQVP